VSERTPGRFRTPADAAAPPSDAAPAQPDDGVRRRAAHAIASLHLELALAPKPGLVTPFDRGSHDDMDAATFIASLQALRQETQRSTPAAQ